MESASPPEPRRRPSPEPLVSLEETARYFGLPKSWLYKQTGARRIPFYKVGHYCMFRLSEVEAYLQARRVEPQHG